MFTVQQRSKAMSDTHKLITKKHRQGTNALDSSLITCQREEMGKAARMPVHTPEKPCLFIALDAVRERLLQFPWFPAQVQQLLTC